MVSKVGQIDDEGGDYRGSVSPQQFWEIICDNSGPFFELFNKRSDKDAFITKFEGKDEDFCECFFKEGDVESAESAWNSLDGTCQEEIINIIEEIPELKTFLTEQKNKLPKE